MPKITIFGTITETLARLSDGADFRFTTTNGNVVDLFVPADLEEAATAAGLVDGFSGAIDVYTRKRAREHPGAHPVRFANIAKTISEYPAYDGPDLKAGAPICYGGADMSEDGTIITLAVDLSAARLNEIFAQTAFEQQIAAAKGDLAAQAAIRTPLSNFTNMLLLLVEQGLAHAWKPIRMDGIYSGDVGARMSVDPEAPGVRAKTRDEAYEMMHS